MSAARKPFEAIYEKHRAKLFRYARRICRNIDDAEDLTQETFVRAFRAYGRFQDERPVENWLLKIACNAHLDHLRRDEARPKTVPESSLALGEESGRYGTAESSFDAYLEAEANTGLIRAALDTIDRKTRELFVRACLIEEPHAALAAEYGIRPATLRSRLFRARNRMRKRAQRMEIVANRKSPLLAA